MSRLRLRRVPPPAATPSTGGLGPYGSGPDVTGPHVAVPAGSGPDVSAPRLPGPDVTRPHVPGPVVAGPHVTGEGGAGPGGGTPAGADPDVAVPRAAVPRGVRGARGGPACGLPGRAEDVLLTGEISPVVADVLRAAGTLEGAEPAGLGEGLRADERDRCARGEHVQQPGTARLRVGLRQRCRRGGQRRLHLVGGPGRVLLEQQRDGAGDDCGGLRGAGALEVAGVDDRLGVLDVDDRAGVAQRDDRLAGCDQVDVTRRRTARGEVRNGVVELARGAVRVVSADGEDERVSRGVVQRRGRRTAVAAGHHDDDAGLPRVLHRGGERVELVALHTVGAVGQVDDTDVHAVVVAVLHDPVDAGDDLADVDGAVVRTDLHTQQLRAGGDALEAGGGAVVAGDDAGHVGAVAEAVVVGELHGGVVE